MWIRAGIDRDKGIQALCVCVHMEGQRAGQGTWLLKCARGMECDWQANTVIYL